MSALFKKYIPLPFEGDVAVLLLRVALSLFLFFGHGMGKILKLTSNEPVQFLDPIGIGQELSLVLATTAETLGALFMLLGLFTRVATIPVLFTLGVACFIVHGSQGFSGMETLLLYLLGFIVVLLMGPGKYALDARM
ncbi:MAG: DoxX family protein [Leeuwenhoekiella sp.]|nr:DoxX family protein [Leeuwenhoekiella sp.]|tara:strand:+ start:279 stop:689 length:411 start_codon:yes stop_codon:yes gene_type:complete